MSNLVQNSSQDPASFGWKAGQNINAGFAWKGISFPGGVAQGTEAIWTDFLNELIPQIPGGIKSSDCWGYEDRANVNDTSKLSFHAYGLALDINAVDNPNDTSPGTGKYQIPSTVGYALAAKYGMEWGGSWKDAMHFELHLTPTEVASYNGTGMVPSGNATSGGVGSTASGSGIGGQIFTLANAPKLAVLGALAIVGVIIVFTQSGGSK